MKKAQRDTLNAFLTLNCGGCHAPPRARSHLLQLQLHVVHLLLRCGTHRDIYISHSITTQSFRWGRLCRENKRCPCRETLQQCYTQKEKVKPENCNHLKTDATHFNQAPARKRICQTKIGLLNLSLLNVIFGET